MARTAARRSAREEAREPAHGGFVGRDGQVLTRNRDSGSRAINQFHVPEHLREAGWSLQWCRMDCHGKPDPANLSNYQENGWTPVPASRAGFAKHFRTEGAEAIVREGLVLMERPDAMTQEAREDDRREALLQRNSQVEEFALSELPPGFDRGYGKAATKVNRTVEGAPLDSYPKHEIALGDDD